MPGSRNSNINGSITSLSNGRLNSLLRTSQVVENTKDDIEKLESDIKQLNRYRESFSKDSKDSEAVVASISDDIRQRRIVKINEMIRSLNSFKEVEEKRKKKKNIPTQKQELIKEKIDFINEQLEVLSSLDAAYENRQANKVFNNNNADSTITPIRLTLLGDLCEKFIDGEGDRTSHVINIRGKDKERQKQIDKNKDNLKDLRQLYQSIIGDYDAEQLNTDERLNSLTDKIEEIDAALLVKTQKLSSLKKELDKVDKGLNKFATLYPDLPVSSLETVNLYNGQNSISTEVIEDFDDTLVKKIKTEWERMSSRDQNKIITTIKERIDFLKNNIENLNEDRETLQDDLITTMETETKVLENIQITESTLQQIQIGFDSINEQMEGIDIEDVRKFLEDLETKKVKILNLNSSITSLKTDKLRSQEKVQKLKKEKESIETTEKKINEKIEKNSSRSWITNSFFNLIKWISLGYVDNTSSKLESDSMIKLRKLARDKNDINKKLTQKDEKKTNIMAKRTVQKEERKVLNEDITKSEKTDLFKFKDLKTNKLELEQNHETQSSKLEEFQLQLNEIIDHKEQLPVQEARIHNAIENLSQKLAQLEAVKEEYEDKFSKRSTLSRSMLSRFSSNSSLNSDASLIDLRNTFPKINLPTLPEEGQEMGQSL